MHGNHHHATESRIEEKAEAEAEDRAEVVADAERGAQGETGGARGEAGGGNRQLVWPEVDDEAAERANGGTQKNRKNQDRRARRQQ